MNIIRKEECDKHHNCGSCDWFNPMTGDCDLDDYVLKGNYTKALEELFVDIFNSIDKGYPYKDFLRNYQTKYDKLKEMFPDMEEMPQGTWSSYNIFGAEHTDKVIEIGLYREPEDILKEQQSDYPEVVDDYYMAVFFGGDWYANRGGDLYMDKSFLITKDKKIL